MRRREFITLLSGAAAWPIGARAQQGEQIRRIGVLGGLAEDDPEMRARLAAFRQELEKRGWSEGRNIQIDYRFAPVATADQTQLLAKELVALRPDVIFAQSTPIVATLRRETSVIPIVFANVADPVGAGLVDSLARPGGNVTGFMNFEFGMSGKWLELLKQIAPRVTHAAVIRDSTQGSGTTQLGAIQAVAPSLGVDVRPIDARDADEIERGITAFARRSNGGLIVTGSALAVVHRDLIITLAARHRLPAVYSFRYDVTSGGLVSYGPDTIDPFPTCGRLCRSYPQGREAGGPAGAGTDQIRAGH